MKTNNRTGNALRELFERKDVCQTAAQKWSRNIVGHSFRINAGI